MSLAHDIKNTIRTRDVQIVENITFSSMLLSELTLAGLKKSGFHRPSPIQLHSIPLGKCGFDLLLEAKSGTGKTAVFSLIALEKLDFNKGLQVLILTPTREIAAQICNVIKQLGLQYKGLNVEVVMGGLSIAEDIAKFKKKVHIVVGSPGRVKHLILEKHMNLSTVRLFVLDECDKLMEKAFLNDINYIFSALPDQKQVIMSSATYPENCNEIINKFVKNAQHICPDSNNVLIGITQKVTLVKYNSNIVRQTQNRFEQLILILSKFQFKQCLIFCNYQARVTELHRLLKKSNWPVCLLYGQQEQSDRLCALKNLQDYKCRILISTDLAARGLDGSNVDLVINFEPPFEWQTYLHRIGRAGRFGSYGTAITILSEGKERINFKNMLNFLTPTFNLTNLWTEEVFSLDKQENIEDGEVQLKNEPIKVNGENYELWKLLTKEKDLLSQVPCISKNLNETHEKLNKCEIESFTNLVTSFQNDNEPNTEVAYELPQVENYFELLNISATSTNHVTDKQIKEEKDNNHNNITKHITECANSYKNNIFNSISEDEICKENYYGQTIQNKNEQSLIHKTMLEAGLPICFGKSRCNRIDAQQPKRTYRNKFKQEIESNSVDYLHKDPPVGQEIRLQNKKKVHRNVLNHCRNASSQSMSRETKQINNNKDAYIIWYNTLKNNMRHIEYLAYIDELSKI